MACGVTKNGVVCDNPGASNHTGPHSGLKAIWGFNFRVYWRETDLVSFILKRALPGVYHRENEAIITPPGYDPTPPVEAQLTPAGMQLNTRFACSTGWSRPNGWIVRSGFPDTEIESNALVMNESGNVRIHVRGDATGAAFATVSKRVVKNGTVLQTWSDVENDHTVDTSVITDDDIWVEFSATAGFGTSYIEANSGTYIYTEVL